MTKQTALKKAIRNCDIQIEKIRDSRHGLFSQLQKICKHSKTEVIGKTWTVCKYCRKEIVK